jgi:hypothetical protein
MSRQLQEPILEQGIRNTNFFNGRLLTADDLKTEQNASRQQHQQLGQAIGEGVIEGLEVALESAGSFNAQPVVVIRKGAALNRRGQVLALLADEHVGLVRQLEAAQPDAGIFRECGTAPDSFTTLEDGTYVLVIGPTSGFREYAPMRDQHPSGKVTSCGSRYIVTGVQLRMAKLDTEALSATLSLTTQDRLHTLLPHTDAASLSKLHNLLAHLCFGTEEMLDTIANPFKQISGEPAHRTYGALDFMRAQGAITDCEVPLALLFWRGGTVRFLDMWSARRHVTPPEATGWWSSFADVRRESEGRASFLQFQEHVEALRASDVVSETIVASQYFNYLPAAGILPLAGIKASRGINYLKFFEHLTYQRPIYIQGSKGARLLRDSFSYPPIDLGSRELIRLYLVKENIELIDHSGTDFPQAQLIFANGQMPYRGDARFDLAYFDYANYALNDVVRENI